MEFTFGIITNGSNTDNLKEIVASIEREFSNTSHKWEYVIVGGPGPEQYLGDMYRVWYIPFDETEKPGWITRKKNLITHNAHFNIIVYMHDYIKLSPGWLYGYEMFGGSWHIAMNRINNKDGTRYRDWCCWDDPDHGSPWVCRECWCGVNGMKFDGKPAMVQYTYERTNKMYISGAYWVAKKDFMLTHPLDEKLVWGQGEDVEWSLRVRDKGFYRMNIHSTVEMLKYKDPILPKVVINGG